MVFQNYALFPHMTVGENVAYGLKVKRFAKADIANRVQSALGGVGMGMLVDRPIAALSGGQQQRVALARAMAVTPRVLLFDEPLSNLDLALRDRTRTEIRRIQQDTGITSLYVTHDQIEAMAMSDRIAVMRDGRVEQMGTPQDLFEEPETAFVASFLGSANIIRDPTVIGRLTGVATIAAGRVLAVRPQAFILDSPSNSLDPAKTVEINVIASQYLGAYREVTGKLLDGTEIRMNVDPHESIADVIHVGIENWIWVADD
jgi:ABC-type sugar transport system ATPase subunit